MRQLGHEHTDGKCTIPQKSRSCTRRRGVQVCMGAHRSRRSHTCRHLVSAQQLLVLVHAIESSQRNSTTTTTTTSYNYKYDYVNSKNYDSNNSYACSCGREHKTLRTGKGNERGLTLLAEAADGNAWQLPAHDKVLHTHKQ